MNNDQMLTRFESFRHQFEDHLVGKDGQNISFTEAVSGLRVPKLALVKSVRELLKVQTDPTELGHQFYHTVLKYLKTVHRIEVAKLAELEENDRRSYNKFCAILGDALLSSDRDEEIFDKYHHRILSFHMEKIENAPSRGTVFHLLFVALGCKENSDTIFGTVTFIGDVTEFFQGDRMFKRSRINVKESFQRLNNTIAELSETMSSKWGWNVLDKIDVQSALWLEFKNNKPKYDAFLHTMKGEEEQFASISRNYEQQLKHLPDEPEQLDAVQQRLGQNALRSTLLKNVGRHCMVTGMDNEHLLRVTQIKPWSECKDKSEQLDPHNCLLLSALWDAAFESGLVTFDDGGKSILSEELKHCKKSITQFKPKFRIVMTEKQKTYMKWHREKIFHD